MALVADTNFTNNLTSVAAFSPFPTGGGNKVLKIDNSGVLLDNTPAVSNLSNADCKVDALVSSSPDGTAGDFGFILNRNGSGKFYYIHLRTTNGSNLLAPFIYRYSGGVGGSFTQLYLAQPFAYVSPDVIFSFVARVESTARGPNLSLLINGTTIFAYLDLDTTNQINSGQPGLAGNLIATGSGRPRYLDNWFVRQSD